MRKKQPFLQRLIQKLFSGWIVKLAVSLLKPIPIIGVIAEVVAFAIA